MSRSIDVARLAWIATIGIGAHAACSRAASGPSSREEARVASSAVPAPPSPGPSGNRAPNEGAAMPMTTGDTLKAVRQVASSEQLAGKPAVEIELWSERPFPPMGEMPVLRVGTPGATDHLLSRYGAQSDLHTLIFTLTLAEFAALPDGAELIVQYGRGDTSLVPPHLLWHFGPLQKRRLTR